MTPDDHINAAADLLNAEEKREQINLLTKRYPEMSMDDAYAVQSAIYRAKIWFLLTGLLYQRNGSYNQG